VSIQAHQKDEYFYGVLAINIGFILVIIPYLGKLGILAYLLGVVLLIQSKRSNQTKLLWILLPPLLVGLLYMIWMGKL
jgi:hypothetical protein